MVLNLVKYVVGYPTFESGINRIWYHFKHCIYSVFTLEIKAIHSLYPLKGVTCNVM